MQTPAVRKMHDFPQNGFAILPDVVPQAEIARWIDAISKIGSEKDVRSRGGVYAIRNLLNLSPLINRLAYSAKLCSLVEATLANAAFPVRGTVCDKTASANWLVPWHQDLTICVAARIDVPGYGPWTTKAGVCHVQPPVSVLESMVSVRIHLEDCDESHGALRILPGTHRLGRLMSEQIAERRRAVAPVACCVKAGGVELMRPLLLHSSSAGSNALHRRVIHIDYACSQLDGGLQWSITGHHMARGCQPPC